MTINESPFAYISSVQDPTAVTHSVTCHLTSEHTTHLALAKRNRLEICHVSPNGVYPILEVPIFGTILYLNKITPRLQSSKFASDLLFVVTDRLQYFVLRYDGPANSLVDLSVGQIPQTSANLAECGLLVSIDIESRFICLHFLPGLLHVLPLTPTGSIALPKPFILSISELNLIDITFVNREIRYDESNLGSSLNSSPAVAILFQDDMARRFVKIYAIETFSSKPNNSQSSTSFSSSISNVKQVLPVHWNTLQLRLVLLPIGSGIIAVDSTSHRLTAISSNTTKKRVHSRGSSKEYVNASNGLIVSSINSLLYVGLHVFHRSLRMNDQNNNNDVTKRPFSASDHRSPASHNQSVTNFPLTVTAASKPPGEILSITTIRDNSVLFCDDTGSLFLAVLAFLEPDHTASSTSSSTSQESEITAFMGVRRLGYVSPASAISPLAPTIPSQYTKLPSSSVSEKNQATQEAHEASPESLYVFIASTVASSQLVCITSPQKHSKFQTRIPQDSYTSLTGEVHIVSTYQSLAPIIDLCPKYKQLTRTGDGASALSSSESESGNGNPKAPLFTCSGGFSAGKFSQSSIGCELTYDSDPIPLSNIAEHFSLQNPSSGLTDYIVLSHYDMTTRVLALPSPASYPVPSNEELQVVEVALDQRSKATQTIHAQSLPHTQASPLDSKVHLSDWVQVTPDSIAVHSLSTGLTTQRSTDEFSFKRTELATPHELFHQARKILGLNNAVTLISSTITDTKSIHNMFLCTLSVECQTSSENMSTVCSSVMILVEIESQMSVHAKGMNYAFSILQAVFFDGASSESSSMGTPQQIRATAFSSLLPSVTNFLPNSYGQHKTLRNSTTAFSREYLPFVFAFSFWNSPGYYLGVGNLNNFSHHHLNSSALAIENATTSTSNMVKSISVVNFSPAITNFSSRLSQISRSLLQKGLFPVINENPQIVRDSISTLTSSLVAILHSEDDGVFISTMRPTSGTGNFKERLLGSFEVDDAMELPCGSVEMDPTKSSFSPSNSRTTVQKKVSISLVPKFLYETISSNDITTAMNQNTNLMVDSDKKFSNIKNETMSMNMDTGMNDDNESDFKTYLSKTWKVYGCHLLVFTPSGIRFFYPSICEPSLLETSLASIQVSLDNQHHLVHESGEKGHDDDKGLPPLESTQLIELKHLNLTNHNPIHLLTQSLQCQKFNSSAVFHTPSTQFSLLFFSPEAAENVVTASENVTTGTAVVGSYNSTSSRILSTSNSLGKEQPLLIASSSQMNVMCVATSSPFDSTAKKPTQEIAPMIFPEAMASSNDVPAYSRGGTGAKSRDIDFTAPKTTLYPQDLLSQANTSQRLSQTQNSSSSPINPSELHGSATSQAFLRFYCPDTQELQCSFRLNPMEEPTALTTLRIPNLFPGEASDFVACFSDAHYSTSDSSNYLTSQEVFALGTAFVSPDETESTLGAIYLLHFDSNTKQLSLLTKRKVLGGVTSLTQFRTSLVASINSTVIMYKFFRSSSGFGLGSTNVAGSMEDNLGSMQMSTPSKRSANQLSQQQYGLPISLVAPTEAVPSSKNPVSFASQAYPYRLLPGPTYSLHDFIIRATTCESQSTLFVGTLSQSVFQLQYEPQTNMLHRVAHEPNGRWCTDLCPLTPNIALVADDTGSLTLLSRFSRFFNSFADCLIYNGVVMNDARQIHGDSSNDNGISMKTDWKSPSISSHSALRPINAFHLGDSINRLVPGACQNPVTGASSNNPISSTTYIDPKETVFCDPGYLSFAVNHKALSLLCDITSCNKSTHNGSRLDATSPSFTGLELSFQQAQEMLSIPKQKILFGTVSGAIGAVSSLSILQYFFLSSVHLATMAAATAEKVHTLMTNATLNGPSTSTSTGANKSPGSSDQGKLRFEDQIPLPPWKRTIPHHTTATASRFRPSPPLPGSVSTGTHPTHSNHPGRQFIFCNTQPVLRHLAKSVPYDSTDIHAVKVFASQLRGVGALSYVSYRSPNSPFVPPETPSKAELLPTSPESAHLVVTNSPMILHEEIFALFLDLTEEYKIEVTKTVLTCLATQKFHGYFNSLTSDLDVSAKVSPVEMIEIKKTTLPPKTQEILQNKDIVSLFKTVLVQYITELTHQ